LLAESIKVLAIERLGPAERCLDDVSIETEEVLGNEVCAWILGVESGDEGGWVAGWVAGRNVSKGAIAGWL
jgi:hypothetical protein